MPPDLHLRAFFAVLLLSKGDSKPAHLGPRAFLAASPATSSACCPLWAQRAVWAAAWRHGR